MALIVVKVTDEPDGQVNVSLESEPPFDLRESGVLTPAQTVALGMLTSATEDAESVSEVRTS